MRNNLPLRVLLIAGLMAIFPGIAQADDVDFLQSGEKAFSAGKYQEAEQFFSQAVAKAPNDHKVLRALAETKMKLEKFQEAETLIDRILANAHRQGPQCARLSRR